MMVRRNDADFRLVVNRAIAQIFRTGQQAQLFQTWIAAAGIKPAPMLLAMYQVQTLAGIKRAVCEGRWERLPSARFRNTSAKRRIGCVETRRQSSARTLEPRG